MCEYLLRSQLFIDFRRRERAKSKLTTCNQKLFDSNFIRNLDRSKIIRHIDFATFLVIDFVE